MSAEPSVKLTPDFKVGDSVIHIGEKTTHTILKIDAEKNLTLSGVATLIHPAAVKKA
jgi:hypothetical protein